MGNWEDIFKSYISSNNFSGLSPMVVDMMAKFYECSLNKEIHKYPLLQVRGSRAYNCDEIKYGIKWLGDNGITDFVIVENSTVTLELIYNLLAYNSGGCSYSIEIRKNYYKNIVDSYGGRKSVWGILVHIKKSI